MINKPLSGGSLLAKLFPTMFKQFSENATQEDFNQAEQEAAVVHQQLQALETKPTPAQAAVPPVTAAVPAVLITPAPTSAASDKPAADGDTVESLRAELATAQTGLTQAQTALTAEQNKVAGLQAKADQWDAYQASLKGTAVTGDATNGTTKPSAQLSDKDAKQVERIKSLQAKHPDLMADLGIKLAEDEE